MQSISLTFCESLETDLANIAESSGQGWALIARYGDHPHPGPPSAAKPMLQRFALTDAEALVANFNAGANRIRRAVVGVPIYDGHPDADGFERIFPDIRPHGTFAELAARDDGLYGRPILTSTGGRLVEDGKDRLSPLWQCEPTGETLHGRAVVRPTRLRSVGLVSKGNIPGPSLLNAATNISGDNPPGDTQTMKTKLIELLGILGVTAAPDADDAVLGNAVDQGLAAATKSKTDLATATTDLTAAQGKITTLEGEKTTLANTAATAATLTTDLANARTALAAERRERATLVVNAAWATGRLPATEREAAVVALCNAADFSAESARLAARPKILKTESAADALGRKLGTDAPKGQQVLDLVNARMDSKKETYEAAYAHVMLTPEYQALMAPATGALR